MDCARRAQERTDETLWRPSLSLPLLSCGVTTKRGYKSLWWSFHTSSSIHQPSVFPTTPAHYFTELVYIPHHAMPDSYSERRKQFKTALENATSVTVQPITAPIFAAATGEPLPPTHPWRMTTPNGEVLEVPSWTDGRTNFLATKFVTKKATPSQSGDHRIRG